MNRTAFSLPARSEYRTHGGLDVTRAVEQFSGGANRLDDLCLRYSIDNSRRTKHGALLDAELLAEVYIELIGARQAQLILSQASMPVSTGGEPIVLRQRPAPLGERLTADERLAHRQFIVSLGDGAIWRDYVSLD